MKVAAIQMVSAAQVAGNLEQARALLAQAAGAGVELAVLPEFFCLMARRDADKLEAAERFGDGPIQRCLADCARDFGLWIVGGTVPLEIPAGSGQRIRSASLVFDPTGACVARYDKMHLFRFDNGQEQHDESRVLEPGSELVCFDLPSRDGHRWRVGLSVCYDLRFPELYRSLAAELLLVPSAFTVPTGRAHWELLLRARAVENLAFVLAPAQGGLHENGRRTWGHSMLVDPWGDVIAQHDTGPAVLAGAIDAHRLAACRTQLPALQHRMV